MFKKARKEGFARVNEDFRAASKSLDEVKAMLVKIGGALGVDLSGHVGTISDLAPRFKKGDRRCPDIPIEVARYLP